ncbi:MAG: hypothetical protein AYK19_07945 [Theionarchaea archaeon DG-70-1]|nr:MAG: hypothetical protein AYK19_07945 [Theionarchaea archaeon DG-70-1]
MKKKIVKKDAPYKSAIAIEKNVISVKISSEICAHELFYRIKKCLAESLGKTLKIGIKAATIKNYEITFTLEKNPLDAVKIPFVSTIEVTGIQIFLTFLLFVDYPISYSVTRVTTLIIPT